ncbi:ATP-dependent (S)-NAD(P)H-hydrate dehydratase [Culicoides brevitarsis]|uniref:ATP-dependent (S)-NAD(P)H-hydrate dehydratase n=1 Tax=Culicoides brevitarsis TaxID=469753 RepID=UPI00307BF7DB
MVFFVRRLKQNLKSFLRIQHFSSKMSDNKAQLLLERAKNVVPVLSDERHKGQYGRIGVFGGSMEYTGAPYLAAISALKTGADLVHVFCPQQAAQVIKSYSPELIVHPVMDSPHALAQIEPWLERLHVCVIGPGLGRDQKILRTISELIRICRQLQKPLIVDADGLFLLTQDISLVAEYQGCILTPNAIEFSRLFGNSPNKLHSVIEKLGSGVTVLEKGPKDIIYDTTLNNKFECAAGGSGRRCGGQGDLLAGVLSTFYFWAIDAKDPAPADVACFAASMLAKTCNELAFRKKGRSMTTSDMVEEIHNAFETHFEHENN